MNKKVIKVFLNIFFIVALFSCSCKNVVNENIIVNVLSSIEGLKTTTGESTDIEVEIYNFKDGDILNINFSDNNIVKVKSINDVSVKSDNNNTVSYTLKKSENLLDIKLVGISSSDNNDNTSTKVLLSLNEKELVNIPIITAPPMTITPDKESYSGIIGNQIEITYNIENIRPDKNLEFSFLNSNNSVVIKYINNIYVNDNSVLYTPSLTDTQIKVILEGQTVGTDCFNIIYNSKTICSSDIVIVNDMIVTTEDYNLSCGYDDITNITYNIIAPVTGASVNFSSSDTSKLQIISINNNTVEMNNMGTCSYTIKNVNDNIINVMVKGLVKEGNAILEAAYKNDTFDTNISFTYAYTVTFNVYDGTTWKVKNTIENIPGDSEVPVSSNISGFFKFGSNYTFLGWTDKNLSREDITKISDVKLYTGTITHNKNFYAVYGTENIIITYKTYDGSKWYTYRTINDSSGIYLPELYADSFVYNNTTYDFYGWTSTDLSNTKPINSDSNNYTEFSSTIINNITVYAMYTIKKVNIKYMVFNGTNWDLYYEKDNINTGSNYPTVATPNDFLYNYSSTGNIKYQFKYWTTDNLSNIMDPANITGSKITGVITQKTTIYAVYEIKKLTVSFSSNGNGSVNYSTLTVDYGSILDINGDTISVNGTIIKASPNIGYNFEKWSEDRQVLKEDTIISASFVIKKFTIYVESNDTSKGTIDISTVDNVPYGTNIIISDNKININGTTVTGTPTSAAYHVSSWDYTPTITDSETFTANFVIKTFTVTVKSNGNGMVNNASSVNITNVPYGTTYTTSGGTLTINTATKQVVSTSNNTGYSFGNWSSTSGTITDTTTISATFNILKYTVTVKSNGNGSVSATSIASVPYGSTVTVSSSTITINGTQITTSPSTGYHFDNWSVSNGYTITGTVTISATFSINYYTFSVFHQSKFSFDHFDTGPWSVPYGTSIGFQRWDDDSGAITVNGAQVGWLDAEGGDDDYYLRYTLHGHYEYSGATSSFSWPITNDVSLEFWY